MSLFLGERSWIEIDREKLKYNIDEIKKHLKDGEEIIAVVKANAYGHNDKLFAKELYDLGIRKFAVACLSEAINIREVLDDVMILILGYTPYEKADYLVKYNISQSITSVDYLENLYKYTDSKIKIHIAIDTGMSRIGLNGKKPEECIEQIEKFKTLYDIEGMFTHMSCADDDTSDADEFTKMQIERFKKIATHYKDEIKVIHYKNSSGIIRDFEKIGSACRAGIIIYGLYPSEEMKPYIDLKAITSWYSVVTSVRNVEKGEYVSYNKLFQADKDMKIASVACGYSDGYRRTMTNKVSALINGKKVKVLGRICMDQLMIDVTGIDNVCIGTKVTLIGKDGQEEITASDLAKVINTNHYDILSNISPRVDRIVKRD